MVVMINRLHRSPKSASVTSPARVSLLTCGFTLGLLALVTPNTAYAWDCPGVTEVQIEICEREGRQTPTPAPSSGGSGSSFFEDWGGLLFAAGIIAFIAWVVIANLRESAADKEQRAAAELARGRALAEQHHLEQVAAAEQRALAQLPDPSVYDPMNMGVQRPNVEVPTPAAPPTDPDDLKRYATFGAVVPWEPGTAFAAVVNRDGDWSRARGAFASACEAAGLGETDEAETFTPAAVVAEVRTIGGDTDAVVLAVRPAGLHIGSAQLDRARPYLVRTARVAEASPFEREPSTDLYLTTLRNVVREQSAPAPEAAPISDPSTWEW